MTSFTIDQAGKIEDTAKDTILALHSNEIQYAMRIPSRLKQEIFFRCKKSFHNNLTLRIFAHCLALLMKSRVEKWDLIIIDNEYPGHSGDIKNLILNKMQLFKENIGFECLGKKDGSHRIANQTFSGKLKPNEVITSKNLNLNLILPDKLLKKFLK